MELSDWISVHADDLLLGAGVLVSVAAMVLAAILAAVRGCELTLRALQRVARWRVAQLHQAQLALAIRQEMESRARRHRAHGEQPECARLRGEAAAVALQIGELRALLQAQEEVLSGRAGRISALELAAAEALAQTAAAQALAAERGQRIAALVQACGQAERARDQCSDELAQRDQVIRMLESQLAAQGNAAALAQAGMADARVQSGLLQEQLRSALARCALLAELRELRGVRGGEAAACAERTLIAR